MATPRRTYTEEQRAAAVADALLLGVGASAAKHGVPVRTLFEWRASQPLTQFTDPAQLKKERIGALVATYLEANLQALTAQAYAVADPDYIKRQPADSLAVLHGVMADKSIRLLEALHSGERRATATPVEIDS